MSDHQPFGVVCSCGRLAVVRWSVRGGRYTCRARGWRYSTYCPVRKDGLRNDQSRLWHCGRRGHRQAFAGLPEEWTRRVGYRTRAAVMWADESLIPAIARETSRQTYKVLNNLRVDLIVRDETVGLADPLQLRELHRLTLFVDAWVRAHVGPLPTIPEVFEVFK